MALKYKAMSKKMFERMRELDDEIGSYEVQEHQILSSIVGQVGELAKIQAHVELRKDEIDLNTILTANDPCIINNDDRRSTLTVDRNYAIQYLDETEKGNYIVIIDDVGAERSFPVGELEKWFSWTLLEWKYKDQMMTNKRGLK